MSQQEKNLCKVNYVSQGSLCGLRVEFDGIRSLGKRNRLLNDQINLPKESEP